LNANLVNLNPNAQPIVSSRGEGNPNPKAKISLSNNFLKIIKKKSNSPDAPTNSDANAALIKVSPVRGIMAFNSNKSNGEKHRVVLMKKVRKSPSPPSSAPL
jgi:hypothetical protein